MILYSRDDGVAALANARCTTLTPWDLCSNVTRLQMWLGLKSSELQGALSSTQARFKATGRHYVRTDQYYARRDGSVTLSLSNHCCVRTGEKNSTEFLSNSDLYSKLFHPQSTPSAESLQKSYIAMGLGALQPPESSKAIFWGNR